MIKPMTIKELKKELKKLEQSELIELISGLYKTNDNVKEIVNVKFIGEKYQEELLESYKEKMYAEFFPKNMKTMPSFISAKEMITEFRCIRSWRQEV